jgi:predicted dehydrogenase
MTAENQLMLYEVGKEGVPVTVSEAMGYELEIDYLIKCIAAGQKPTTVTLQSAAQTLAICEAEAKSIERGRAVKVKI